jgi:cell division cycle 20-like protein 1 (cofactor of APC complex)
LHSHFVEFNIEQGQHVAVGTKKGLVQIWDAARCQRLRTMDGHGARVSSLAWASSTLASGSRYSRFIHLFIRVTSLIIVE